MFDLSIFVIYRYLFLFVRCDNMEIDSRQKRIKTSKHFFKILSQIENEIQTKTESIEKLEKTFKSLNIVLTCGKKSASS